MDSIKDLINEIENALKSGYKFPYYALVRITTGRGTYHIPAPWFESNSNRGKWAACLPIAADQRDGLYYTCPMCGEPSFFAGICQDCARDNEEWDDEFQEWVAGDNPLWYRNHEALKRAEKTELLRRIDHGVKDLGVVKAEMVLSVPWGAEWDTMPYFKDAPYGAVYAIRELKNRLNILENGTDPEDVVILEGSPIGELRRQIDRVWQHKHPGDGYDYWHPIERVHKKSGV